MDDNGTLDVRFGPHPTDKMPLEWAEKMLTELKETAPNMFGKLLIHAIGIEKKAR